MHGKQLSPIAKKLRKAATDTENHLWLHLKAKRFQGLKFRRQHPIGRYIVDFVCLEKRIIIELDGGQHADCEQDVLRDSWLESEGYRVLRFWNNEVIDNLDGVLEVIRINCFAPSPSPPPLKGGGTES